MRVLPPPPRNTRSADASVPRDALPAFVSPVRGATPLMPAWRELRGDHGLDGGGGPGRAVPVERGAEERSARETCPNGGAVCGRLPFTSLTCVYAPEARGRGGACPIRAKHQA